ncbi:hypothetical protein [Sphingosinicella sp. CPCC 101087]|uniref:hypothetical protein n=1 Tax=Sphingosinicella sp. CPCC 101087 TaxID=2497754 RepID=UPI00101C36A2|nr:hypothetical protein [Sphingosinicella sp. CPCC 101087]
MLVWLALRNAAVALFAQAQPSFALAFPPPSGDALAVQALRGRSAPERQEGAAAEALARSPVSYWPILAAAEAALAKDDDARGTALLVEAVRRNSRQADSRGRLFQLLLSQGRWSESIDEGLAYTRLRASTSESVMHGVLMLLGDVRGRAILARKLRTNAELRERLVRLAARRPEERQLATLLDWPEGDPDELSADGYIAWVQALPDEALPHVRAVYDGEFRGLPGSPPFGWRFARDVRVDPSEGLIAQASAGEQARQTLVLSPGPYRLTVFGSGRMAWRISCLSGAVLVEAPLPAGDPAPVERPFTVPAGCAFQQLALTGTGGASRTLRVAVRPGL